MVATPVVYRSVRSSFNESLKVKLKAQAVLNLQISKHWCSRLSVSLSSSRIHVRIHGRIHPHHRVQIDVAHFTDGGSIAQHLTHLSVHEVTHQVTADTCLPNCSCCALRLDRGKSLVRAASITTSLRV